ncbi:MAG TPA: AMP-binding protein [Candidatus Dormibacteraeota bacterium]|jgi:crotonobetaine/carnitine-CoA ligase
MSGAMSSLRDDVAAMAAVMADQPLAKFPDGTLTYADAWERGQQLAATLIGRGHGEGSVVATCCGNGTALFTTWLAALAMGAVFMPVNGLLRGEALVRVLREAGVSAVVCDRHHHDELASMRDRLPALVDVIVDGVRPFRGELGITAILASPSRAPLPALTADDTLPAKLMYTSGSTGVPKGAVWSRRCESVWAHAYATELVTTAPGETAYTCLPMTHVTCQGTVMASLLNGGTAHVDARFEPFSFWQRVRDADACIFTFVGTILATLARRPPRPDDLDNPVRRVVGAATPVRHWSEFEERFGLEIVETWGQTETAACWFGPATMPMRPGSVGVPSERCQARLVDADGCDVPRGSAGQLLLRPSEPQLMFDRYLDDRETGSWNTGGWYETGDVLRRGDDGAYEFLGRQRDVIRRHGETIAPSLIEEVAIDHPAVQEAVALAVPDPDAEGEDAIRLCLTGIDGVAPDVDQLVRFLHERLPRLLWPRFISVHDEFPRTETTRVRRAALRSQAGVVWDLKARRWVPA